MKAALIVGGVVAISVTYAFASIIIDVVGEAIDGGSRLLDPYADPEFLKAAY